MPSFRQQLAVFFSVSATVFLVFFGLINSRPAADVPAARPPAAEAAPKPEPAKDEPGKDDPKAPIPPSMTRPDLGFDPPTFAKLRADPKDKPFSFLLMGDQHFSGTGDSVKFMNLFMKKLPELPDFDFIVTLGDQINNGGNYRDWLEYGTNPASRAWFDAMAARGIAILPMAGNHEPGGRAVSNAEKAMVTDDKEIERLIAASSADPELRQSRIAIYRSLRSDLRAGVLTVNRPDWGKYFEINFYEDLYRKNADRLGHVPTTANAEEMWYSLRHGNCLFLFADGNHNTRDNWKKAETKESVGLRQFKWMERELQAAERDGLAHAFVCVHQPMFVSDNVHETDARDMRTARYPAGRALSLNEIKDEAERQKAEAVKAKKDPKDVPAGPERELVHWAELFRRYRVSAIFSGHVHRYERFLWEMGNGRRLPCMITGGSGTSRGRSALNPDPEVLTVDHLERSLKGTIPRTDILKTAPGQMIHQMYPLTNQQQAELAEKKYFVVRVTVNGPKVAMELLPLEELKRDGKAVPVYESVPDLLTEPAPKPVPPTRTNFRRHVVMDGGFPYQVAVGDIRGGGATELLDIDLAAGVSLSPWNKPQQRQRIAAVDSPSALLLHDLDGNGLRDLFVGRFGRAGARGAWYWLKNPGPAGGEWKTMMIDDGPYARGAQAAVFADLNGDGREELVVGCYHSGVISYYTIPRNPAERREWKRHDLHFPEGTNDRNPVESYGLRCLGTLPEIPKNDPGGRRPRPMMLFAAYSRAKESLASFEPVRHKDDHADGPSDLERLTWKRTVIEAGPADISDMVLADINGDGLKDIVVIDRGTAQTANKGLTAYIQGRDAEGKTTWTKQVIDKTVNGGGSLAAGDLDGDGRIDLVVTHRDEKTRIHSVQLFRNKGGTFERKTLGVIGEEGPLVGEAGRLTIQDLNNDGRPDVLVAGLVTGRILWFETLPPDVPGDPE